MVPPGSWSPAGTAAKPKTVPPVSSDRRQPGATRQSGGANWCHPPVRHAGSSPADSAWKPETVPPRFSPKQCHPSVRRHHADLRILGATPLFVFQDGATRQFAERSMPPPSPRMVPPVSSEYQYVSRPGHPPVRLRQGRRGSPEHRAQNSATRQSGGANWCHPPVRHASSSPADSAWKPETVPPRFSCSKMVPPVSLPASVCRTFGATPQSGGRKWRRCSWPLRPELLPFARSDRFQFVTHRRWLCWPGDPERKASRLKKLSSPTR